MVDVVENNCSDHPPTRPPLKKPSSVEFARRTSMLGHQAQQTMKRYTWERSALMLEKLFRQVIASEGQTSA
jgi:hypothetical protein